MKYWCACLGLEGILENKAFAAYILQDMPTICITRNMLPMGKAIPSVH